MAEWHLRLAGSMTALEQLASELNEPTLSVKRDVRGFYLTSAVFGTDDKANPTKASVDALIAKLNERGYALFGRHGAITITSLEFARHDGTRIGHGFIEPIGVRFTSTLERRLTKTLERLQQAIHALRTALQEESDAAESVFHVILNEHPLLLDIYGSCESKPSFEYPAGKKSPIEKTRLQPDFLIVYPNRTYKLIEIERPQKPVSTDKGHPRSEVTQATLATFQTAEWKLYIKSHYHLIADRYPGIHTSCKYSLIMSRSTQRAFRSANEISDYKGLITEQYRIDEFLTFDDLYERACTAYKLLSGLNPTLGASS